VITKDELSCLLNTFPQKALKKCMETSKENLTSPEKVCADTSFFTCKQVYSGSGTMASLTLRRCSLSLETSSRFKTKKEIIKI